MYFFARILFLMINYYFFLAILIFLPPTRGKPRPSTRARSCPAHIGGKRRRGKKFIENGNSD